MCIRTSSYIEFLKRGNYSIFIIHIHTDTVNTNQSLPNYGYTINAIIILNMFIISVIRSTSVPNLMHSQHITRHNDWNTNTEPWVALSQWPLTCISSNVPTLKEIVDVHCLSTTTKCRTKMVARSEPYCTKRTNVQCPVSIITDH